MCTQKRENGRPVAPSLCAISFSWCGKIRSMPPACMSIGASPSRPQRHRRALDVPARTPGADAEIPRRLVGLGRLPQHEIARVFLARNYRCRCAPRAGCRPDRAARACRTREGGDAVVDRPFAAIRVAARVERLDHLDHRAQVRLVGRARHLFHRLEPERRGVLPERGDELVGVLRAAACPAFCAPAIVRSSTSVKFMTWCMPKPHRYLSVRRSTSMHTNVRKLPMWPRLYTVRPHVYMRTVLSRDGAKSSSQRVSVL